MGKLNASLSPAASRRLNAYVELQYRSTVDTCTGPLYGTGTTEANFRRVSRYSTPVQYYTFTYVDNSKHDTYRYR